MALSVARSLFSIAAFLALTFGLGTAVRAYRSPIRRRWLWILISLLGAPVTTMNWTTGEIATRALTVQLLNVGVVRPGPTAPWFLSVAFPIGAFLFLNRRRRLVATARPLLAEDQLD